MPTKDAEFVQRLRQTFRLEAEEHMQVLAGVPMRLEECSSPLQVGEVVEAAFREAHSLKGAARAVNLPAVERLCHGLESAFSALKRRQTTLSEPLLRALEAATETLEKLLAAPGTEGAALPATDGVIEQLERTLGVTPAPSLAPTAAPAPADSEPRPAGEAVPPAAETLRIPIARLNTLMLQAEELRAPKLTGAQRIAELRELTAVLRGWKKLRARVAAELRQLRRSGDGNGAPANGKTRMALTRTLDFLEHTDAVLAELETRSLAVTHAADLDQRALAGMVDALLDNVKQVLMLPLSSLLEGFPRLVRELARERGKRVELEIAGAELEADRRILQELKTPLVHLLRNVIDHGIETAEERERQGKPPAGRVRISTAARQGDKFQLVVEDDGGGVDAGRVREAAIRAGIITEEQARRLDEHQVAVLIFESGLSTSPIVTELSGRGLGLAIVREKVERLGGTVTLFTERGRGTAFRIELPLTLTTFRGVVVRAGDAAWVVPVTSVERVLRVAAAEVRTVENRETVVVEGQPVSLVRLAQTLGVATQASAAMDTSWLYALVLSVAGKRIAFAVDEIVAEQEVLVKSLGQFLERVPGVFGATVLGGGRVVPILHVPDLMKAAAEAFPERAVAGEPIPQAPPRERAVLLAEDSITARALLKNILEAAGYHVKTAVDGAEAFALLKTEEFDLVVSDVEMPRMNGFDLTARIRADKDLSETPVVLVTALESREDRERGIDAGANAYIVKSSFDQSNLLEVVARLL